MTTRLSLNHLSFVFVTLLLFIKEVKFMNDGLLLNVRVGIWWPRVILFYCVINEYTVIQLQDTFLLVEWSHKDFNLSKSEMENLNQKKLITFLDKRTKQNRIKNNHYTYSKIPKPYTEKSADNYSISSVINRCPLLLKYLWLDVYDIIDVKIDFR